MYKMKLTMLSTMLMVAFVMVDKTVAETLSEERADFLWANHKVSFRLLIFPLIKR